MKLDSAVFYSSDITKVIPFYRDLIGLELEYQQGDKYVSFLFENKVRLGIKRAAEEREKPGGQTIFIEVENIEEWYKKMKKENLNFHKDLTEESWGTHFAILDPDKNKIEFIKRSSQ